MNGRLQKKSRDSFNLNLVRARLDALSEIWIEARNVHFQIINQEEENFDNYLENTFSRLQQLYEDLQEFLLGLLTELEVVYEATIQMPPLVTSSECELPDAKLPKLDLLKFSGEYEDWKNFYDVFTSLVHNKRLNKIAVFETMLNRYRCGPRKGSNYQKCELCSNLGSSAR